MCSVAYEDQVQGPLKARLSWSRSPEDSDLREMCGFATGGHGLKF